MSQLNVGTVNITNPLQLPSFTTANRPTGVSAGHLIYNSTTNQLEFFNGSSWSSFGVSSITATGGNITTVGGYKIHTFTGNGSFVVSAADGGATVEYLIVAGGGGGGVGNSNEGGGGGGGGGVVYGRQEVTAQTYNIIVGGGGTGSTGTGTVGGNGGNSSAFGFIAVGGGGGACCGCNGSAGGSGGGGSGCGNDKIAGKGIQAEQGYGIGTDGGFGRWVAYTPGQGNGGDGGGALMMGRSGIERGNTTRGDGGKGIELLHSGTNVEYARGGRGGQGQGGSTGHSGAAGGTNEGDGGDGTVVQNAPAGGSGIVIIKYLV